MSRRTEAGGSLLRFTTEEERLSDGVAGPNSSPFDRLRMRNSTGPATFSFDLILSLSKGEVAAAGWPSPLFPPHFKLALSRFSSLALITSTLGYLARSASRKIVASPAMTMLAEEGSNTSAPTTRTWSGVTACTRST